MKYSLGITLCSSQISKRPWLGGMFCVSVYRRLKFSNLCIEACSVACVVCWTLFREIKFHLIVTGRPALLVEGLGFCGLIWQGKYWGKYEGRIWTGCFN